MNSPRCYIYTYIACTVNVDIAKYMYIYGTSVFQHVIIMADLGRNDLSLCETSDNTLYT